jgi:hypothetical protein
MREPTVGILPDVIWKVTVAVVVTAESLRTIPVVGPVFEFQLPSTYSGLFATRSGGIGLKGLFMY